MMFGCTDDGAPRRRAVVAALAALVLMATSDLARGKSILDDTRVMPPEGQPLEEGMQLWPAFFPDDCPPGDSQVSNGRLVYRYLVRFDPNRSTKTAFLPNPQLLPVGRDNMLTHKEANRGKKAGHCGLSCFNTRDEIDDFADLLPQFRGALIVRGDIPPNIARFGEVDDNGHFNMWLMECARLCCFRWFEVEP